MDNQMYFYGSVIFLLLVLIWKLHKIMVDDKNPIEWWQFIASVGKDGKPYADITKLGQATGILLVNAVTVLFASRVEKMDWLGFCGVLTLVLSYLAGVQFFQAYLKSKGVQPPKQEETK